jgi:FkbM family methyltransferase
VLRETIARIARSVVNVLPERVARPALELYVRARIPDASPDARAWIVNRADRELFALLEEVPAGGWVIDLGGYLGDFCARAARQGARIVVCEPIPQFAAHIRKRLGSSVIVREVGVSGRSGETEMTLAGAATSRFGGTGPATKVPLVRCSNLITEHNIDNVDLVKINIEGDEYEVLPELLDAGMMPRIDRLLVQFHPMNATVGERRRRIRERLSETHDCVFCYEFIWEGWRRKASPAAHEA